MGSPIVRPTMNKVGMFRTGLPKDAQHGIVLYTAEVFEEKGDKVLVNYPIGLNYRQPEWVGLDMLVDWISLGSTMESTDAKPG